MATSSGADYFGTSRPAIRTRQPSSSLAGPAVLPSPGSPRTPLLGRSISSQFGSPGVFRLEQDDYVIYELGARHLSAGFAGESRPRHVIRFDPEQGRRVGDYRAYTPGYQRKRRKLTREEDWGADYELYRCDLRNLDLGLVEDKLERAARTLHVENLQLDQKPRKAVLTVPSLLPTPLLEIALKVLFNYSSQPPTVTILTMPLLACVGAGLRHALVIDIGWEETVVTAIGEYKEVFQRRSVRAGKLLTREMAKALEKEAENQRHSHSTSESDDSEVNFEYAEEVTERMGWCRSRPESATDSEEGSGMTKLPLPDSGSHAHIHVPFNRLSKPAEALFTLSTTTSVRDDDHDLSVPELAYSVLLVLPVDLRPICISRIIATGGVSALPGLKQRLLQEIDHLISIRGWDPVQSYGSATAHHNKVLQERSANIAHRTERLSGDVPLSPTKKPIQESIPHAQRIHDDTHDTITQKAEREASKGKVEMVKGVVRGVETLGAWAGTSLIASLRVKGVCEIEREDFLKHGFRDEGPVI